jgi:hypothetical protein
MAHNNAINADSKKRRFALLFTAGYGGVMSKDALVVAAKPTWINLT